MLFCLCHRYNSVAISEDSRVQNVRLVQGVPFQGLHAESRIFGTNVCRVRSPRADLNFEQPRPLSFPEPVNGSAWKIHL